MDSQSPPDNVRLVHGRSRKTKARVASRRAFRLRRILRSLNIPPQPAGCSVPVLAIMDEDYRCQMCQLNKALEQYREMQRQLQEEEGLVRKALAGKGIRVEDPGLNVSLIFRTVDRRRRSGRHGRERGGSGGHCDTSSKSDGLRVDLEQMLDGAGPRGDEEIMLLSPSAGDNAEAFLCPEEEWRRYIPPAFAQAFGV